jgi:hypothetical protein
MTPIAQMDCCTMLGIDPKTLRNWLRHACMQFIAHPTDARLKCLMPEQVHQLAILHARPLQMAPVASSALQEEVTSLESSQGSTLAKQENEMRLAAAAAPLSEDAELRKTVCSLEAQVMTLQEHLTQLTLELLHERSERYEQRLSALEALLPQRTGMPLSAPEVVMVGDHRQEAPSTPGRSLLPVELRARARVIPRVEYGAAGLYVLVCPREGVLSFLPDSTEWFDWLASLTSFRFLGPQGRFTAYRDSEHGQRTRYWTASRCIHGREYRHYLGVTDHLTLARLEQKAAKLQSRLASLSFFELSYADA